MLADEETVVRISRRGDIGNAAHGTGVHAILIGRPGEKAAHAKPARAAKPGIVVPPTLAAVGAGDVPGRSRSADGGDVRHVGRDVRRIRAAVQAGATLVARAGHHGDAGGGGAGQDGIDALHVARRGLVLAISPTVRDHVYAVIDHRVEDRLEAALPAEGGVIDNHIRSRRETHDRADIEQDFRLLGAGCARTAGHMDLRELTELRRPTDQVEEIADIGGFEILELDQADLCPAPANAGLGATPGSSEIISNGVGGSGPPDARRLSKFKMSAMQK